ncbi:hypothetical protein B9Z55_022422 [Caenorhabditis nigoni]|uniref:Ubiquitin-like protease family profile domain-containing protein n=1 Tax=Caenorhabditis nigoni TaxID=1611254 RepID=A0A2G5SKB3_9PELO|nr:hypothetical protein B9Z55_022422 [Caenorhabditis nigoni]
MLHPEQRLQQDKKNKDYTKVIFDKLRKLIIIPRATEIRLLEAIARRWEIIGPIEIDSNIGDETEITRALDLLTDHIRRQVEYEFDLSTEVKKLLAILHILKFEINGEKMDDFVLDKMDKEPRSDTTPSKTEKQQIKRNIEKLIWEDLRTTHAILNKKDNRNMPKITVLRSIAAQWGLQYKLDPDLDNDSQVNAALTALATDVYRKNGVGTEIVTTNASHIPSSSQSISSSSSSSTENQSPLSIDASNHISDVRRLGSSRIPKYPTPKGAKRRVVQKKKVHPSGESRCESEDGPIAKKAPQDLGSSTISLQPFNFFSNSSNSSSSFSNAAFGAPETSFCYYPPQNQWQSSSYTTSTSYHIPGYSDWIFPTHSGDGRNKQNPPFMWNGCQFALQNPQVTGTPTEELQTQQSLPMVQKVIKQPSFIEAKRSQRKELNKQNLSSLSIRLPNPLTGGIFYRQSLYIKDLMRLRPKRWLGDSLIQCAIDRLVSENLNPEQQEKIHLFDSTFFSGRAGNIVTAEPPQSREKMAESMMKACVEKQERKRKIPIFEKDLLVVPVNHSKHWILCLVVNPKGAIVEEGKDDDENKCRIIVFDSIGCTVRKKDVVLFMKIYMRQQFEKVWKLNGVFQEEIIEIPEVEHPYKQLNDYDCGVYTIMFCQSIFINYTKFFEAQNKPALDLHEFDKSARNANSMTLRTDVLNWFLELVDEEFCPDLDMNSLIEMAPALRDII